jgi:hypothetical protein
MRQTWSGQINLNKSLKVIKKIKNIKVEKQKQDIKLEQNLGKLVTIFEREQASKRQQPKPHHSGINR